MSITSITYSADEPIAVTAWTTTLLAGEKATSAIFDNTAKLYMDLLVGGIIELDATTPVVGNSLDIYVGALYDKDTTTTAGGGIDALLDPGTPAEEVADTDFVLANLILFKSIQIQATATFGDAGFVFNPQGVAQFFGGIMPQKIYFLLHNNTAGAIAAGSVLNGVGITYTTV